MTGRQTSVSKSIDNEGANEDLAKEKEKGETQRTRGSLWILWIREAIDHLVEINRRKMHARTLERGDPEAICFSGFCFCSVAPSQAEQSAMQSAMQSVCFSWRKLRSVIVYVLPSSCTPSSLTPPLIWPWTVIHQVFPSWYYSFQHRPKFSTSTSLSLDKITTGHGTVVAYYY